MSKKNTRFLIWSCFILISLFIVDRFIGKIGDYSMTRLPNYSGQLAKCNFNMNRLKTDIVLLGSSRCSHHYVTMMLQDSINNYVGGGTYSLYNGGIEGRYVNYNCCTAESIMERFSPRMIIFEVSESELTRLYNLSDMDLLLPLYTANRYVKQYMDALGWKKKVKCESNLYRYNQILLRIASSFFASADSTGYEPLYKEMTVIPEFHAEASTHDLNDYSTNNLSRVMEKAQEKGIQMIVVSSPRFMPSSDNRRLADFCAKYEVPYIDLYNLELFNSHPEYFQDQGHLNDKGAHIYSSIFFEHLKPYLYKFN